jgi:hypothetical protein
MDWYNGYKPSERSAMGRALYPASSRQPPCSMCGDPSPAKMQTHSEDYSKPYRWDPPASYPICSTCHSRLHSRFKSPARWNSYLLFLRRGWFAREVSSKDLQRQAELGGAYPWRHLDHPSPTRVGPMAWWWESLTLDAESLHSPVARPRP